MPSLNVIEFPTCREERASPNKSSVSGSWIGSESSLYNRNKPKLLSWVLIFGREGSDGTSGAGKEGGDASRGWNKSEGSTLPGFFRASILGGNSLGGSGMKSL